VEETGSPYVFRLEAGNTCTGWKRLEAGWKPVPPGGAIPKSRGHPRGFDLDTPLTSRYLLSMNRRMLQWVCASVAVATGTGCFPTLWNEKPNEPKLSAASVDAARRVDDLAKRILDQNVFTGIEPVIRVIGVPEAVLFHRGANELFISEGLVKKCKTEAELAAVLCTELGRMMSQKRAAVAVGRAPEPIPEIALPGIGSDASQVRQAELAMQKRRDDQKRAGEQSGESQLAKDLLKGSGFDPAEFDRVQGMVKQSDRGDAIRNQLNGTAPTPTWK